MQSPPLPPTVYSEVVGSPVVADGSVGLGSSVAGFPVVLLGRKAFLPVLGFIKLHICGWTEFVEVTWV